MVNAHVQLWYQKYRVLNAFSNYAQKMNSRVLCISIFFLQWLNESKNLFLFI